MGEVYRATDTRLKRGVALKILPESFAADPQRIVRFQREAEVLASLNHPNIAAIHGLEQEGGIHAIAMELVEGETLAARMQRGGSPSKRSSRLHSKSSRRWKRPLRRESSTAISNPPM